MVLRPLGLLAMLSGCAPGTEDFPPPPEASPWLTIEDHSVRSLGPRPTVTVRRRGTLETVALAPSTTLFDADYRLTHHDEAGRTVHDGPPAGCRWDGVAPSGLRVVLRGCTPEEVDGYLIADAQIQPIEPTSVPGRYRIQQATPATPSACGTEEASTAAPSTPTPLPAPRTGACDPPEAVCAGSRDATCTKWVKLRIIHDAARVASMGGDLDRLEQHAADLVQAADALYASANLCPPVRLSLASQEVWDRSDPWPVALEDGAPPANPLLESFGGWAADNPGFADHTTLLTGLDLAGSTIGAAWVGTPCSPDRAASVVQTASVDPEKVPATLAHELGHHLGARHDGVYNTCAWTGFLMQAGITMPPPTTWSTCSTQSIDQTLIRHGGWCFDDGPAPAPILDRNPLGGTYLADGNCG